MINRLKALMEEPEERPPAAEYFEIACDYATYYVGRAEARRVASILQRRWRPRWLRFRDFFGAEVQVLTRAVTGIVESSVALRQRERDFHRERRGEDRADRRPWEDEDW